MMVFIFKAGPGLRQVLDSDTYQGHKLEGLLQDFPRLRHRTVDALVDCLEQRCANLSEGVLEATKIADLSTWPLTFDDSSRGLFFLREKLSTTISLNNIVPQCIS